MGRRARSATGTYDVSGLIRQTAVQVGMLGIEREAAVSTLLAELHLYDPPAFSPQQMITQLKGWYDEGVALRIQQLKIITGS